MSEDYSKTVFLSGRKKLKLTITNIYNERPELFNEEFYDKLNGKITRLEKQIVKIMFINFAIIGALYLDITNISTSFKFFGLDFANLSDVRELLVFVSISLMIFSAIIGYSNSQAKEIKKVLQNLRFEDKSIKELDQMLNATILGDLGGFYIGTTKNLILRNTGVFIALLLTLPILITYTLAAVVPIIINGFVIYEVIQNPSLPNPWNVIFVSWVCLSVIAYFFISVSTHIPLPYEDYSIYVELAELLEKDKDSYYRRIEELEASRNH